MAQEPEPDVIDRDPSSYCREIETYLCRKNEGHLVRIVGPAFEQVCGWAERGVPLKIAFRGIDRYCDRYYAKGNRRRPVRIEFCEADILDAFDDWRRAVGIAGAAGGAVPSEPAGRKPSLAAHVERAAARLRTLSFSPVRSAPFVARIDRILAELDRFEDVGHTRGESRLRIVSRLAALDEELMAAALDEVDPAHAVRLRQEAEEELAPFGARMLPEARQKATGAAFHRLVREALGAPTLTYE
jgi:hypothetical protein